MRKTHKERVLEYVERFGSISSLEAFRDLGNTRLSATIFSLKKDGYKITTKNETALNRFGDKTTYCRYYIEEVK
jgi:hypothetical protein